MAFEPMRGLSFEDYQEETRRRQAEGARYSALIRKAGHGEDKRASARLLAAQGLSVRAIAKSLVVSVGTVHAWIHAEVAAGGGS
jgi:DNA invertase Pin-like site-specific DNA recombinase